MPSLSSLQLPPPRDWQELERLCCDLFRLVWQDPDTQLNGRQGQAQQGVDVYGRPGCGPNYTGVQCKLKGVSEGAQLTEEELREEVAKAKGFRPKLASFIISTTAPNDATIQKLARKITEEHEKQGLFDVAVYGWGEIVSRLEQFPEVIQRYYPSLAPRELSAVADSLERLETGQREQSEVLSRAVLAVGTTGAPSVGEALGLEAQIDQCRDLIREGRPSAAIALLERLASGSSPEADHIVQFRITTNLGAAHLTLGNDDKAASLFLEAYVLSPESEVGITNAATAHLIQGNASEARALAERACELFPDSRRARVLWVSACADDSSMADPVELLDDRWLQSFEVALTLSQFFRRRGSASDARGWALRAYELNPDHLECRILAGQELLAHVLDHSTAALAEGLTHEETHSLERAAALLEEAWVDVQATELAKPNITAAINLATALSLTGEAARARQVIESGLAIDRTHPSLRRARALDELRRGSPTQCLHWLDGISPDTCPDATLIRANALAELNRFGEIRQILDSAIERGPDEVRAAALSLSVQLDNQQQGFDSALARCDELLQDWAHLVDVHVARARLLALAGRPNPGERLLELSMDGASTRECVVLADALFDLELYESATDHYARLSEGAITGRALTRYLTCLINTNQRARADERLAHLPSHVLELPLFLQIKARLSDVAGDLPEASRLYRKCLDVRTQDLGVRLALAQTLRRLGDHGGVRELLSNDGFDVASAAPSDRIRLAQLLRLYDQVDRGVGLAYETLRDSPDNADVNMGYIGMFFGGPSPPIEDLTPEEVIPDSAFTVEESGTSRTFVIDDRSDARVADGELNLSHPLAQRALGKRVGDLVAVTENPLRVEEGRVAEIKHKYLHALHDLMSHFEERFPTHGGLIRIPMPEVTEETLEPIRRSLTRRKQAILQAEDWYQNNGATLGMVGRLIGTDLIDTFLGIVSSARVQVSICDGTEAERAIAMTSLTDQGTRFVIDPLALFVAHRLGLLEAVTTVTGELAIAQSTIDLYSARLEDRELLPAEGFFDLSSEGKLTLTELHETNREEARAELERLRSWASANCVVLPAIGRAALDARTRELLDLTGREQADPILIANGDERVLISDDHHLRQLAVSQAGVRGVWLQPLLMAAVDRGTLSLADYASAVAKMLEWNLSFVSLHAAFLKEHASRNGWHMSSELRRGLETLGLPHADFASSVGVGFAFLRLVWSSNASLDQRRRLTFGLLNALTEHHWTSWESILAAALSVRASLPSTWGTAQYDLAIRDWCLGHFLRPPPS